MNCAELTVNPVNSVVLLGKQLPLWHQLNWAVKGHRWNLLHYIPTKTTPFPPGPHSITLTKELQIDMFS